MASGNRQTVAKGGFWSATKVPVSKDTQQLLKVMMEESKLTNFQRRQLQQTMDSGKSLPLKCHPTTSAPGKPQPLTKQAACLPKVMNARHLQGGKRTKEEIDLSQKNQPQDVYIPPAGRHISEKDKRKLQNTMAYGELGAGLEDTPRQVRQRNKKAVPEIDRFDELLDEIEERRNFLAEMEKLGKGRQYRTIIDTEISQKIRDLEVIDKKRMEELQLAIQEEEHLKKLEEQENDLSTR